MHCLTSIARSVSSKTLNYMIDCFNGLDNVVQSNKGEIYDPFVLIIEYIQNKLSLVL